MEPTVEAFLPSKSPANAAALSSYGEENMATATQLIVYMPYLHWDYYKSMLSRTRLIKDKIARVGKKSNAENAFTSPGMEQKVLHQYVKCGNDWSIHPRRSLDQYGYPTLANTNVRNADQVMYKAPKVKGIQGIEDDLRPPARMRLRDARNKPPKRRKDSKRDRSENVEAADYDEKAKVLMVDQCWFHQQQSAKFIDSVSDGDLKVFRVMSDYISYLTEYQMSSFKQFRDGQLRHDTSLGEEDEQSLRDVLDNLHNSEDLTNLLELRDVVKNIIKAYEQIDGYLKRSKRAKDMLIKTKERIHQYRITVNDMMSECIRARDTYTSLLDLKQKQANIAEARLARLSAQVAGEQSRAVMIFTIFTILFLPLSFFTSLFGMNAREWSGQDSDPDLSHIGILMGSISAAVIIIALLVAFNKNIHTFLTVALKERLLDFIQRDSAAGDESVSDDEPDWKSPLNPVTVVPGRRETSGDNLTFRRMMMWSTEGKHLESGGADVNVDAERKHHHRFFFHERTVSSDGAVSLDTLSLSIPSRPGSR
ncbi:hypothetical protein LTS18_004253 [Coniosporium uncinatum]|uniref:Uncharacterized protein n=1 Tax=Coniosporium uncinatum TaxID=93489 RepID=A0ACC3DZW4_9PEZI|nr:hypothetical protein LTS18_004253 [Coniosporium uncinatum]